VRFVPPRPRDSAYELKVHETGEVETRADHPHDYFNALAWLAFPRTKARINAMHAAEIPREGGRRGPLRDLLTVVDEGGALVQCDDAHLIRLLNEMRWKELFWDHRDAVASRMRVLIFGHASLEQALEPWPGITCKAIIAPARGHPDAQMATWLGGLRAGARPRDLGPLPVFGLPGWHPAGERAAFYEDARYFRPQLPSR